jgi:outer membrane protein TolC
MSKKRKRLMKKIIILMSAVSLLLFQGCALLKPTDPYTPITRDKDALKAQSLSSSAVHFSLNQPLTLDAAIETALANNPEVSASGFDAEAAKARKDSALGALFPRISTEGGYTHYLDDQRLVPARYNGEPGVFGDDIYSADAVIRMTLFAGGRLINEMRAADLLRQSAERRTNRTREELVFNVTSVFYGILAQERLVSSLIFSKSALEAHLKRVKDLIDAQKAARVDQLRTEVRLSDITQKLVRERNAMTVQRRVLGNFMGMENTSTTLPLAGTLENALSELIPLEDHLSSAFERRPDYQAARKELEAQARRVDVARAGHSPIVSLFGSYGGRWAANPTDNNAGLDESEDVGRVGLNVELPIFEGGRIQARIHEERAKLAAAQERLRKLELQIRLDVETAQLNMTSAFERVQTTEKAIEQARESLRIEREKYELGKGAIMDVLDAQSALLDAETNYYRALADFNVARAQLQLATGGGIK